MRKFKLWNNDKTQSIDLIDRKHFATNPEGLGLENDLTFVETNKGSYLDKYKMMNNDISFTMLFNGYNSYDTLRKFISGNGKNSFVLEYLSHKSIVTQKRIDLGNEPLDIDILDDEYFVRAKGIVSKYGLKPETIPFVESETVPDIKRDKYAEVVLLQGQSEYSVSPEEYTLAQALPNGQITEDVNGQKLINVDKVTLPYQTISTGNSVVDIYYYTSTINSNIVDNDIIVNNTVFTYNLSNPYIPYTWKKGDGFVSFSVPKGTTLSKTSISLTYELAHPRYAKSLGINSVVNPTIESINENLFDWYDILSHQTVSEVVYKGKKALTYVAGSDTSTQWFLEGRFKENTVYTLSGYFAVASGQANFRIYYTDGTHQQIITDNTEWEYKTVTSLPNQTISHLRGIWNASQNVYLSDIMLNTGTTPLPYTPNTSTKIKLLGQYNSIPKTQVADEVKPVDGILNTTRKTVKVDLWGLTFGLATTLTNTYYFSSPIVEDKKLKSLNNSSNASIMWINSFKYSHTDSVNDSRHYYVDYERLRIFIEKSLIQAIMTRDGVNEVTACKTYLEEEKVQGTFELANYVEEVTEYEGGLELTEGSNLYVSDENHLLDSIKIRYKLWNWSNVIKNTNLKKYTMNSSDLIIYLKKSEVSEFGSTPEEQLTNYFKDKYASILLQNYIENEEYIYRDVYVQRLSKGELNQHGILESEFVLKPHKGWYQEVAQVLEATHNGNTSKYEIEVDNSGYEELPINFEIISNQFTQPLFEVLLKTQAVEGVTYYGTYIKVDFIGYTINNNGFQYPMTFILDSRNHKIYRKGISYTFTPQEINEYGKQDLSQDSFILLQPGTSTIRLSNRPSTIESAEITMKYRRYI
jgi:hypothetical protein